MDVVICLETKPLKDRVRNKDVYGGFLKCWEQDGTAKKYNNYIIITCTIL